MSVKDACDAAHKFGNPELARDLCRLNAFNALTTLSIDGRQTTAFTLQVEKPRYQRRGSAVAEQVERQSIGRLVEPYRSCRALTNDEVLGMLDKAQPPTLTIDEILAKSNNYFSFQEIESAVGTETPSRRQPLALPYLNKLRAVMDEEWEDGHLFWQEDESWFCK
ncbi:hypothetical protein LQZ18_10000 [Lachnospiraceae bacterium ZAX-1]